MFRVEDSLVEGVKKVAEVYQTKKDVRIKDRGLVWNTDLIEGLELENLLRNFLFKHLN